LEEGLQLKKPTFSNIKSDSNLDKLVPIIGDEQSPSKYTGKNISQLDQE
jgi:hypothetical protein